MQADRLRLAGQTGEAERISREILSADPFVVPALHLLSILLLRRGEIAEAETLMRRALARNTRDPALSNTMGNVLLERGDAAGAEAAYRTAIDLDSGYAEAHYNLGLALRQLDRGEDALAAFARAAKLRPGYAEALVQTGALLRDLGRPEDALAALDKALVASPHSFDALYYRGVILIALGRYEEAVPPLQAAVTQRPQNAEVQHALGNALSYVGREAEALTAYRMAIDAVPDFVSAHLDFSALAFAIGRKDAQFKSFAYARDRLGDKPELLLAEAEQRLVMRDAVSAESLLRRAGEQTDRADILNALGRAVTSQGRFDEAIALYEKALAAESGNTAHHRELAVALLHDRKATTALPILEQAHALVPSDQFILALTALALRETGDARHAGMMDFDRLVRVYDLPPPSGFVDSGQFNRELAEDLQQLHTRRAHPHDQTLRGGTQTMGHLFSRPSRNIALLRDRIGEAVSDYVARMPDDPAHPVFGRKQAAFRFAGSWSCRLHSCGYHTNHVHPQGWISSAYYVSLPDMTDGEQGWIKFGESNLNLGERDRPAHAVRPVVGRLVLFPSYFWHGTVPFRSDRSRLTVAFDVVPDQSTG